MSDETMTHAEISSDEVSSEAPIENEAMEDEDTPILSDAEEGEAETENDEELTDDESGDEDDEQSDEDQAELETVEVDGKTYKLPKELTPHLMRDKDYRQKTQALAEERRVVEVRHDAVVKHAEILREQTGLYSAIQNVQAQLDQYANMDWQKLHAEDPMDFPMKQFEYHQLREKRAQLINQIEGVTKQAEQARAEDFAKRDALATEWASRNIKGWNSDKGKQLATFARETLKLSPQVVQANLSPKFVEMLHLAHLGYQTINASKGKSAGAAKAAVQAAKTPTIAPTERVAAKGGKTPVSKPIDKMSMEEYAAWRKRSK